MFLHHFNNVFLTQKGLNGGTLDPLQGTKLNGKKSNRSKTKDSNDIKRVPSKTYLNPNIPSRFSIPFDLEEAKKSNILISGTNHTGKSRLACGICSILQNFNWRIIAFDNTGIWREISNLPIVYRVRKARNYDPEMKEWFYPFPTDSMLFDTSLLIPNLQRSFGDDVLERLWNAQVRSCLKRWTLVVLEESQLYMRNIRGNVAQNILRICSAGRPQKIRVLGITIDLALLDPSFIRLCQQRYHARLGIEDNAKRKFRGYYGLDWCRIATELDLGFFIYLLREKLKIINVPLFEPKRLPEPYHIPVPPQPPRPKGLLERFKDWWIK